MEIINEYLGYIAISAFLVAVACVSIVLLVLKNIRVEQRSNNAELLQKLNKVQSNIKSHEDRLHELQAALYGISAKLKNIECQQLPAWVEPKELESLQGEVSQLLLKVKAIESAEPGSKLYTKAAKLVASGATLEDVMQECELPRAEAELLLSLHAVKD